MTQSNAIPVHVNLARRPMGVWESLRVARHNVLEIVPEIATTQPIVSGRTGRRWHMVMDPNILRQILLDNVDNYPKSDVTKNMLRPAIGESLFVAEGAHWRWQRRAVAPVFSWRNVVSSGPIMSRAAEASCARLAKGQGGAIDLYEDMTRTAFDVAASTFSEDGLFEADLVHQAIGDYFDAVGKMSLFDILGLPAWLPRLSRIFPNKAVTQMRRIADATIEARLANGPCRVPDVLDLMLATTDAETGRAMNTSELRDNLLTFIIAGHETTALTLAWSLYLCAFDMDVQRKARAQAQEVLGGRTATAEDVKNLPYLRMIADEALRLYPPAAFVSRTALSDDTLGTLEVHKGETLMMPIYALHRNRLLWDEPDHFRPERFADPKAIPRYSYLPFADGPRICIGATFALQEVVIVLATLLSRFEFTPVPGRAPTPRMIITLRPDGGVWLNVTPLS